MIAFIKSKLIVGKCFTDEIHIFYISNKMQQKMKNKQKQSNIVHTQTIF